MLKGKLNQVKRKLVSKRIFLVLLTFVMIFTSGIFMDGTEAEVISQGPNLTQVGPINESNGFPLWYKDSNNDKLELCLDGSDPLCGLVAEGDFIPTEPTSFPDNYPGEAFYQLAEAAMESPDGRSDAIGIFALEATFNAGDPKPGDQTVFARIRFRIDSLTNGATYKITHPYGVDEIIAADNEISYVKDIGAGQGFDGAMKGRIGTFLKAVSPAPPLGYTGNPNVEQTVDGGVDDQNFFMIEGPGVGNVYRDFRCTPTSTDCIKTDLFSLAGKIATNDGLDIQQATYSQTAQGGAIDVFVSSETRENIIVSGDGIVETDLAGGNGQYFAHVPYTGTEPLADMEEIILTNKGDIPETKKKIKPADRITATANYDTDAKQLTITAKSSDEVRPPTLTVKGLGIDQANVPESGTIVIDSSYIPPTITITSTNLGTVTTPVNINSKPITPVPVEAAIVETDQPFVTGTQVTLDGSTSTGPIDAYLWEQVSGPVNVELSNINTNQATFTAPETPGEYVFKLTVTGSNVSSTSTTTVTISGSETTPAATANAGPDQTGITQGTVVKLDGSGSKNATSYSWKQLSGKSVTLTGANTVNPTFTFPKQPDPVEFELTVTGPDGKTATNTVIISADPDNLSVTIAEFRSRDNSWRIDGKSDVFGPGVQVTIYIVDSANPTGTKLGTATVDGLGDWRFRGTGLAIKRGGTIRIESTSGGTLTYPVTIRLR